MKRSLRIGTCLALFWRVLYGIVLCLFGEGLGAAPVTFNTALPVAQGEFVFRQLFVVSRAANDPGPVKRKVSGWASISVLGYGVSPRWTVFGVLPVVGEKTLSRDTSTGRERRSAGGIGDLLLFSRYTLYQRDRPGSTFRIAPFLGVEAPTGQEDARDSQGRLPPDLQPGSGSWDGTAGVVISRQTLAYQIDAQLSYRFNSKANHFKAGDRVSLDASWQYRLWPRQLKGGLPGFLYGVLETNASHQLKNKISGHREPDSGGWRWFITPGFQYVTRRWVLEGVVQLPVLQNLNSQALEQDWIVRTGFRIAF